MKTKIRTSILFFLLVALSVPTLQSCKKYPEDPAFSLRSRKERVANTWKVENYKINGSDYTSLVADYTETFVKSGAYSYSWGSLNGAGSWSFQNKDMEIRLNGNDDHSSRILFILKLEEKSMWYYYMDGNDKYEAHLVPN
jgi:hypothetical protein